VLASGLVLDEIAERMARPTVRQITAGCANGGAGAWCSSRRSPPSPLGGLALGDRPRAVVPARPERWANESATGLICLQCGHVHAFVGDAVKLWDPEGGYPSGQEAR